MIETRILGDEVSIALLDNGNVGIMAMDRSSNTIWTIELGPEAWRAFLQNAPRLKGVGISVAGRIGGGIVTPPTGGNGG